MSAAYDVIVVGARCAGSPTAMLLARRGYRVLLVDRATFPSDTISTHVVHPVAVAALARWGLRDRLVATGCPPIHTYRFDFGPVVIEGSPGTRESPVACCPRRTVLDELLVRAAADAGAEIREGFTVDDLLAEGGRITGIRGRSQGRDEVVERARIVVGADGRHSVVAEAVRPEQYHERAPVLMSYYGYWSDLPTDGRFEIYDRPRRGFAAAPTHDGLTLVIAGWPYAERAAFKKDLDRNYVATLELVPSFAARLRGARLETRLAGAGLPGFFRKPFGPGWALVGDAAYTKDPVTAQGILDAFRDAERCARALDDALSGARPFEEAMREYQRERDAQVLAMYEHTFMVASLEPPSPEARQLLGAIAGNRPAMDRFAQMNAGTISPAEFFAPESIAAMLAPPAGPGAGAAHGATA